FFAACQEYSFPPTGTTDSGTPSGETAVVYDPIEPVADAGPDAQYAPLAQALLDGSGSFDPAGTGIASWRWRFIAAPEGSLAVLQNSTTPKPTLLLDVAGTYTVELTVQNGAGQWDTTPDRVDLVAQPADGLYVDVSWDQGSDLDLH